MDWVVGRRFLKERSSPSAVLFFCWSLKLLQVNIITATRDSRKCAGLRETISHCLSKKEHLFSFIIYSNSGEEEDFFSLLFGMKTVKKLLCVIAEYILLLRSIKGLMLPVYVQFFSLTPEREIILHCLQTISQFQLHFKHFQLLLMSFKTFSSQSSSPGTVQSEDGVNQACHITKPVTMQLTSKRRMLGKRYTKV